MKAEDYLNKNISSILEHEMFKNSKHKRTVDHDQHTPSIDYEFPSLNVEIQCDLNDNIQTIFLFSQKIKETEVMGLSFELSREQVRGALGVPCKSAPPDTSPLLGNSGGWDIFTNEKFTTHIEYKSDTEGIEVITLMVNQVVPGLL